MKNILLTILYFFVLNVTCLSQTNDVFYLYSKHPIEKLPNYIPLKEGKVYLWADTSKIDSNKIQLLIINNTQRKLNFNGYQLAMIQPEFRDNTKNWIRFSPFFFGWCGTPYAFERVIPPNEFFVALEYIQIGQIKSKVRFTFYGTDIESSNSFTWFIDTSQTEYAKYDDIAYKYCDVEYLINIIKEMPEPYTEISKDKEYLKEVGNDSYIIKSFNENIVTSAMYSLKKRFPKTAIEILESIAFDQTHPFNESAKTILNIKENK
jgi:hypothetical protein